MKNILPALKSVLADLAKLRNKQLAGVVGGVVAVVVAKLLGAQLTSAEAAGAVAAIGVGAATVDAWLSKQSAPAATAAVSKAVASTNANPVAGVNVPPAATGDAANKAATPPPPAK